MQNKQKIAIKRKTEKFINLGPRQLPKMVYRCLVRMRRSGTIDQDAVQTNGIIR